MSDNARIAVIVACTSAAIAVVFFAGAIGGAFEKPTTCECVHPQPTEE